MFLDYRIYKLEERITVAERRRESVVSDAEKDEDAQAYLVTFDESLRKLRKKLDKLKAERYYQRRFTGTGGY